MISKNTRQQLEECRKLMRDHSPLEKLAALGGDGNDSQFEQSFSNLAHAFIKDKAPSLLDYEVGFQLMDRNDDNTKAIGIFGFKVGGQWIYAPVFFLNGDMKGTELLYLKDQDQFVPLKENWLNYILQRKPNVMGSETGRNLQQLGVMSPDLQAFSRPPGKFASAGGMAAGESAFAYFATSNPLSDNKYKDVRTLPEFLKEAGLSTIKSLIQGMEAYPAVAEAIEKVYGKETIKQAIVAAAASEKEAGKKIRWIKQKEYGRQEDEDESPKKPKGVLEAYNGNVENKIMREKASAIAILTVKTVVQRGVGFEPTDKELEDIATEGVSIRDERPDASVAYEVQTPLNLTNPPETGVYDILCKPSKFCKGLVIVGPQGPKGTVGFSTVIDLDDKNWTNLHQAHIWTRERGVQEDELRTLYEDLPELTPASLKEDGLYVIVGGNREGTLPFRVKEVCDKDDACSSFKVDFMDYAGAPRPANLPPLKTRETYWGYGSDANPYGCGCSAILHLTNKTGGRMRSMHNELYVPQGYKVIKIDEKADEYGHMDRGEKPVIHYGNLLDVQKAIYEKTASLDVRHTGSVVSVNGRDFDKVASVVHLVQDWMLREGQARAIVKAASDKKAVKYRVAFPEGYESIIKVAAPGDMMDPSMAAVSGAPPFPSPPSGLEQTMQGSVQSVYPQQEALPVLSSSANMAGNEQIYDPRLPDPKTMALGYKAQQTGQKEVFDTSMVGALLKNVRSDSMVDKYLGDLMKGMDRIGRILFSFYWHGEEMQDRYGKNDMPELEESLRNAFEAVGDVVLFLKQKTVEPFPEEGFNSDLSDTAS